MNACRLGPIVIKVIGSGRQLDIMFQCKLVIWFMMHMWFTYGCSTTLFCNVALVYLAS